MDKVVTIAIDAMGGDYAPLEIVKGAVLAVNESKNINIILVGKINSINIELSKYSYDKEKILVINADEVIDNHESPVLAIRRKKESSIVKAMNLVKEGKADAFISAGSTGAILAGGQLIIGRIRGIERPALAPLIPTLNGVSLLIDCGANVDARASHLVQFAKMGSIYMQNILGINNPKVAIVNIGAEEEKGNQLVKDTFPLLKELTDINFIGSIEARDIPHGIADVIVSEAFVGNVILKLYEGLGAALISKIKAGLMSTNISKVGAMLSKPALKKSLKDFDSSNYGGAPMLGLKNLVVKTHGNSTSNEIYNAILQCVNFTKGNITDKIKENLLNEND